MNKALIFGINGQDGSYLAEFLLSKNYEIHGMVRRTSQPNLKNIEHILDKITLHRGDLSDKGSLYRIIKEVNPDEIYNEADQDHAGWSFSMAEYNYNITGLAVGRILEIIKQLNPKIKYFQPLTSNIFGQTSEFPQTENTPVNPQSPYACAKVFAKTLCKYYREVFGMFVATAIFYNHESPRRTEEYVTQKIIQSAKRIKEGKQRILKLGELSARIDWGYAPEFMEAAWNIMQLKESDDFIICTGQTHSVSDWLHETFYQLGLDPYNYVELDQNLLRPAQTSILYGDYSKAEKVFGYKPKVGFQELIKIMLEENGR